MSLRRLMHRAAALAAALGLGVALSATPARAAGDELSAQRLWAGNHALTIPKRRVELGLLQTSRYGLTDRVELALHPLWFFALPHVELKVTHLRAERAALAVRGRLAYPTIFLGLVSREGSGGLLPKTSEPPAALVLEGDVLGSFTWAPLQLASAALGLSVAPHASFSPSQLPLLDFPFLYPRFAPIYTVLVPRAQLGFEGRVAGGLHYGVELLGFWMPALPDVGDAYALEQALSIEYRFGERVAVALGTRLSEAAYAYGTRLHVLPYFDVRVGF